MVVAKTRADRTQIVLHPNRSATWSQTKHLIAFMALVVGVIAAGWAFAGVWIILPFAGLEVSLLAYLMYRVSCFTYQHQYIDVLPNEIRVVLTARAPPVRLRRQHCHIQFDDPGNSWQLPVIKLSDDNTHVEVGVFLNRDDKHKLKDLLEGAGLLTCSAQWWR
ncbi:DUF2244 domain-containing protein [Alteromonas halophila]|uniref:DUF2244 domain-containing protein n=1 Tax=Alteromonas halophila TaxID=516698 RepID=A0A918JQI3_9ALTE|nr:DUF2244 domain-containing protein [Alteromonas halophila]GGW94786.1 hypothetical protein GCM10007391_31270 [Alteromonas halophila]